MVMSKITIFNKGFFFHQKKKKSSLSQASLLAKGETKSKNPPIANYLTMPESEKMYTKGTWGMQGEVHFTKGPMGWGEQESGALDFPPSSSTRQGSYMRD